MSVFVFDQDTIGMIRYILALQRFKEYSVGPQGLDEYLCAVSFNRVLIQTGLKFPKFQKENPSDIRVYEVIRFLEQKSHINPTTAKKLREYLDFHDSLMNPVPKPPQKTLILKLKKSCSFFAPKQAWTKMRNSKIEHLRT